MIQWCGWHSEYKAEYEIKFVPVVTMCTYAAIVIRHYQHVLTTTCISMHSKPISTIAVTDVLNARTERYVFHLIVSPKVPGVLYQNSTENHLCDVEY